MEKILLWIQSVLSAATGLLGAILLVSVTVDLFGEGTMQGILAAIGFLLLSIRLEPKNSTEK